jgi:predicted Zn-dependent protease
MKGIDDSAFMGHLQMIWEPLCQSLFLGLEPGEELAVYLQAEHSDFLRFNQSRIRQQGQVLEANVTLILQKDRKEWSGTWTLGLDLEQDKATLSRVLKAARWDLKALPEDPFFTPLAPPSTSTQERKGRLTAFENVPKILFEKTSDLDLVGIYASGPQVRALRSSTGHSHWFWADTFTLDYSACHDSGKAVKKIYADVTFDIEFYLKQIIDCRKQLLALNLELISPPPGNYRVYLEPGAFAELMPMFSWHGLSEREMRQNTSAFLALRSGERQLSPQFTMVEDLSQGLCPRFGETGSLASSKTVLIQNGKLMHTLVSDRSALEFGVPTNGANGWEGLRSPCVWPGTLEEGDVLEKLGTGFYLPNLHYINWSQRETASLTGMTRHAAFWVEGGKIKGPISDLRFDVSLYDLLGSDLEGLTRQTQYIPEVSTYSSRHLGGVQLPGLLVSRMNFTL